MRDKTFTIAKSPKYDGNQCIIPSMVYKFLDKQICVEELHKPIIRNFNKRKVHSPFIYNIWGTDLADMQLISEFNEGIRFLLCVSYIFSKYTWVIPLKDK